MGRGVLSGRLAPVGEFLTFHLFGGQLMGRVSEFPFVLLCCKLVLPLLQLLELAKHPVEHDDAILFDALPYFPQP